MKKEQTATTNTILFHYVTLILADGNLNLNTAGKSMFIKKDLRRIEEILEDENVNHDSLMFSKRASEFNSSIQILTYDNHVNFMKNAKSLNLYDNKLSSVSGIEKFRILSNLQDLNLGCNQLSSLPSEVRYSS
jgi:Leucine-rich repeat (LRR) protein